MTRIIGLLMVIGMMTIKGFTANLPLKSAAPKIEKSETMFKIDWKVKFTNEEEELKLGFVESIEVVSDVDNLVDTAIITLPEAIINQPLSLEDKIKRGTEVAIYLGYDNDLKHEFQGYVKEIQTNDSSIEIRCEDSLFLFRKSISNKELKVVSIKDIAQYLVDEVGEDFRVSCDYGITYEKFVINDATAYDVLNKLQQDTKANIYFEKTSNVLHIHPAYVEVGNIVYYSMQKNIETSSLEFRQEQDKKIEVTIESTNIRGEVSKYTSGTSGGDKITMKVGSMDQASIVELANTILTRKSKDRYEGTFDTWLIPSVKPTDSIQIKDEDYPGKTGQYYVSAVTTVISASGGVRTVKPGIKL